jgi:hypothetical protein
MKGKKKKKVQNCVNFEQRKKKLQTFSLINKIQSKHVSIQYFRKNFQFNRNTSASNIFQFNRNTSSFNIFRDIF